MQLQQRQLIVLITLIIFLPITSAESRGQMFGDRSMVGEGLLKGNERFLRGNRSRRDFVGADRLEQTSFVGAQQAIAAGRVRSAVEGFRLNSANPLRVNRPIGPLPAAGMYYPRLEVDAELTTQMNQDLELRIASTTDRLRERVQRIGGPDVRLSFNGSTALLQGLVDSNKTAQLLEHLVEFEPGIEAVENLLEILPPPNF